MWTGLNISCRFAGTQPYSTTDWRFKIMAYWIYENGETIGPLRAIDVLQRAQSKTLVSLGQTWVKFADHPDFSAATTRPISTNANQRPEATGQRPEVKVPSQRAGNPSLADYSARQYWVLWPFSFSARGPYSHVTVAYELPSKILVRCGEKWIPRDRHPDFVNVDRHERTHPQSPSASQQPNTAEDTIRSSTGYTKWGFFSAVMVLLVVILSLMAPETNHEERIKSVDARQSASTGVERTLTKEKVVGDSPVQEIKYATTLANALREYDSPLAKYESLFDTSKYRGEWVLHDPSWRAQAQVAARELIEVGKTVRQVCGDHKDTRSSVLREMTTHYDNVGNATLRLLESLDTSFLDVIASEMELGWKKSRETISILRTDQ